MVLADRFARAEDTQIVAVVAHEIPTLPGTAMDPDPAPFARADAKLREVVEAFPSRTVQTRLVASSSASRALHDVAEAEDADLVVIGSTHRAGIGRVLPGSVGERLLHGAPCAVVVAPRGYAKGEHFGLGIIGVGFDGGDEARLALAYARRLASKSSARLRLIGVITEDADGASVDAPRMAKLRKALEQRLEDAAEFARKPDAEGDVVTVETAIGQGNPALVLAEQGVELDVLVVGSRGYGPVLRTLVGGVSDRLIRLAPCPVVVVPRGEHAPRGAESIHREETSWAARS